MNIQISDKGVFMLNDNEKTEPLGNGMRIIVSDEHKLWTDTILLASFSAPKKRDIACDLGSGCGSIPLIWFRNASIGHVTTVEENAADILASAKDLNARRAEQEAADACGCAQEEAADVSGCTQEEAADVPEQEEN